MEESMSEKCSKASLGSYDLDNLEAKKKNWFKPEDSAGRYHGCYSSLLNGSSVDHHPQSSIPPLIPAPCGQKWDCSRCDRHLVHESCDKSPPSPSWVEGVQERNEDGTQYLHLEFHVEATISLAQKTFTHQNSPSSDIISPRFLRSAVVSCCHSSELQVKEQRDMPLCLLFTPYGKQYAKETECMRFGPALSYLWLGQRPYA